MSVFNRSDEMEAAYQRGQIVRHLNGGLMAMRKAKDTYLRRLPREDMADYEARAMGGRLFNGHSRTLNYFAGQVFSKDVQFLDAGQGKVDFEKIRKDADMNGSNLRTWARELFMSGVEEGSAAVFVDYPHVQTREIQGRLEYLDQSTGRWLPKTAAADREKGWRPFFVLIRQEQILGGRFEHIDGRKTCTMLRVKEYYVEQSDEWDSDDDPKEQVRVLYPGRFEIWRKSKDETTKTETEYLYSEGVLGPKDRPFNFIPVHFFTPGRSVEIGTGSLGFIPAMENLAWDDVSYWIATCDHEALVKRLRNPVILGKLLGRNEDGDIEVGLSRMVHSNDPSGDLRYVGVMDKEVLASRQLIEDIKSDIASHGLMLLTPGLSGNTKTAFQAQREVSESTSTLRDWALDLQNSLDEALKFVAMWGGAEKDSEPWVQVNTDFTAALAFDHEVYRFAIDAAIISRQSAFEELRRRGSFAESLTWETEKERLATENVAPQPMPGMSSSLDFLRPPTIQAATRTEEGTVQGV